MRTTNSGSLAQLVEQLTFNQLVAGSNPARPTIFRDWKRHELDEKQRSVRLICLEQIRTCLAWPRRGVGQDVRNNPARLNKIQNPIWTHPWWLTQPRHPWRVVQTAGAGLQRTPISPHHFVLSLVIWNTQAIAQNTCLGKLSYNMPVLISCEEQSICLQLWLIRLAINLVHS